MRHDTILLIFFCFMFLCLDRSAQMNLLLDMDWTMIKGIVHFRTLGYCIHMCMKLSVLPPMQATQKMLHMLFNTSAMLA